eukprot:gene41962-24043_t
MVRLREFVTHFALPAIPAVPARGALSSVTPHKGASPAGSPGWQ